MKNIQYSSLYRKYRPQNFEGVIGQDTVVRVLKNQVKSGMVSHAYLFTGTRGTGKTSCAKIFAKAVNCLKPKDGSPCGVCDACRSVSDASNYDILEIDAASNNGVDEIRDLRDMVKYAPTASKYKVFIIDEVHMLSQSAFNALLKTLEEPPPHVIFILATTEVHKLPETILSRCMRFDFKLVSAAEMTALLERIFAEQKRPIERAAAEAIAEAGGGSVRDSLSIADVVTAYTDKKIIYNDVLAVLGSSSPETVLELAESMLLGEVEETLVKIDGILAEGKSVVRLSADLTKTLRNLIFFKHCKRAGSFTGLPQEMAARLREVSGRLDSSRMSYVLDIFSSVESRQKSSSHPRIVFESAAIKACDIRAGLSHDALLERVKELEGRLDRLAAGGIESSIVKSAGTEPAGPRSRMSTGSADVIWGHIITTLRNRKRYGLYSAAVSEGNQVTLTADVLHVSADNAADYQLLCDPENIKEMELIAYEGYSNIKKIEVKKTEKREDSIQEDLEVVKNLFDSDILHIKK